MNKSIVKKIIVLIAVIAAISFMTGCGKKTPETTMTHHESGSWDLITTEIYNECMANNDIQGAKDILEMKTYLSAFCCNDVNYKDVKNRDYNSIQYSIGDLQIAVAAYNENNDESAMDVEVDWICQFNSCTPEQHDAIDAYVDWYHTQRGNALIEDYRNLVSSKYDEIKPKIDVEQVPPYDRLTPAQFKEVQSYIIDPSYQVNTSAWGQ